MITIAPLPYQDKLSWDNTKNMTQRILNMNVDTNVHFRVSDGVNNIMTNWTLRWVGLDLYEKLNLEYFFEVHGRTKSFAFKDNDGNEIAVIFSSAIQFTNFSEYYDADVNIAKVYDYFDSVIIPSPTPSPTQTVSPTVVLTMTPTPTVSLSPSATMTPTPTVSLSPSVTMTPTPTVSLSPSVTMTPTPTVSLSPSATLTPTPSATMSPTPTVSLSPSATMSPTPTPSITPSTTPVVINPITLNPYIWYDFSDINVMTNTGVGNEITGVTDKGTAGADLVVRSASYIGPTLGQTAGKYYSEWNGTTTVLYNSSNSLINFMHDSGSGNAYTVFAYGNPTTAASAFFGTMNAGSGDKGELVMHGNTSQGWRLLIGRGQSGALVGRSTGGNYLDQDSLLVCTRPDDSDIASIEVNDTDGGTLTLSTLGTDGNANRALHVGSGSASSPSNLFSGKIYNIIIFNRLLSDSEITGVKNWLKASMEPAPSPTPTPTVSLSPSVTMTPTPTVSLSPSATLTPTPTATFTPTPSVTAEVTPSISPTRTPTSTSPTVTPTITPSSSSPFAPFRFTALQGVVRIRGFGVGSIINWGGGGGSTTVVSDSATYTNTYGPNGGTGTVTINGTASSNGISIAGSGLITIEYWGNNFNSHRIRFYDGVASSINLTHVPTHLPSSVTNTAQMFYSAESFNGFIGSWDTSAVTTMSQMFFNATSFDRNLSSWDTSAAVTMDNMFNNATSFNQNLSSWCVEQIPTPPANFDLNASVWVLPRPNWGAPC